MKIDHLAPRADPGSLRSTTARIGLAATSVIFAAVIVIAIIAPI